MRTRSRDACLIFIFSLPLFLAGLGNREFIEFECRFGLFAKEMLRNGLSTFPTVYGAPYPDYPGLQTVLIVLASLPAGEVTIFTAVLPTAVFAGLTLAFTYLLGASRARRLGILAVLLALATDAFFSSARSTSLDHFLAAATAFTAWAAWSCRRPAALWGCIALGLAVGFAFRGPLGLVVPASVVLVRFALAGDWKRTAAAGLLATFLLALCLALLWLAAERAGGEAFRRRVIGIQSFDRLTENLAKPFYYYWLRAPGVYALSFPLACVAAAVSFEKVRRGRDAESRWLRFLLGWILVILVGLSLPATKKDRYLLPVVPAASLLAAGLFVDPAGGRAARVLEWLLPRLCLLAPWVCLVAFLLLPPVAARLGHSVEFPRVQGALLSALGAASALAIFKVSREGARKQAALFAVGVLALATLRAFLVEPVALTLESSSDFVRKVEAVRGTGPLVFFQIGPDTEDIKYAVNLERDVRPIFLGTLEEVAALAAPACIVTLKENERPLQEKFGDAFRVLVEGKLGHRPSIAFTVAPRGTGR
jgi:4-amino-4-deoxy-L-arabinose transferase-like glycosyltransferase